TVYADGAFAGFSDCPGQGGGTYNIETIGGRYGIAIDSVSRFPILVGCKFTGQTGACIGYRGSIQVPSLLVGCQLEPKGDMAVDFPGRAQYAGINIVDCRISMAGGGVVAGTGKPENIHIEDTYVRGAKSIVSGGEPLPSADGWNLIEQYSSTTAQGVNLINGVESSDEITRWKAISDAPAFEALRERHYRRVPCFDEAGVVNVKDYGAKGDGETDDTEAFKKAIAAGDNVFVPKGNFKLTGTLALRPNTHLFGLSRTFSSIGGESQFGGNSGFRGNSGFGRGRGADQPGAGGGRQGAKGRSGAKGGERRGEGSGAGDEGEAFTIVTVDDPEAAPGFSHLGARGNLQWRSGKGTSMLATGLPTSISGSGGGRFYGAMNMRRQLVIEGLTNPVSLYAFNVERVTANPQSIIRNCKHLRIYYFKVEAGTVSGPNAGDANTPGQISNSSDVRVYCMYGNVRKLEDRPMLEIVNSTDVAVSQLKAFQPGSFPHLIEVHGDQRYSIPSSKTVALFVRDAQAGQTAAR
ncbi:MAG: glycosyl hydrolase family 28-related protein, partial [Planctomycetota bacterium]